MNYHVMVDLETLGLATNAVPHEIGLVIFDDNFETLGKLYMEPDVTDCVKRGLTTDSDTVAWWIDRGGLKQTKEGAKTLPYCLKLANAFVSAFEVWKTRDGQKFAHSIKSFWAWGSDFDVSILRSAYAACDLPAPWPYYLTRDARTVHALAFPDYRPGPGDVAHNALTDCLDQIEKLKHAFETLNLTLSKPEHETETE